MNRTSVRTGLGQADEMRTYSRVSLVRKIVFFKVVVPSSGTRTCR